MEYLELEQAISVLSAHVLELRELVNSLKDDPVDRAKALTRLMDQDFRLENLRNTPRF